MKFKYFLFGPMLQMEKSAFAWWNSKRAEYNLKFLACLAIAQLLFAITILVHSNGQTDFPHKLFGMLRSDLLVLVALNLIYFLWPTLEVILFNKINVLYRKYVFAFLNVLNLLVLVVAIFVVVSALAKA